MITPSSMPCAAPHATSSTLAVARKIFMPRRAVEIRGIAHPSRKRRVRAAQAAETSSLVRARGASRRPRTGAGRRATSDHRADEEAHHVVEEAIRLDLEDEAARPLAPLGVPDRGSGGRRRPARCRERRRRGSSARRDCAPRPRASSCAVERSLHDPLRAAPEGRRRLVVRAHVSSCTRLAVALYRAWKSSRIACASATQRSSGRSAFRARRIDGAVHFSGTRTPTAWPRAWTPASVRPEPSAATGPAHSRPSAVLEHALHGAAIGLPLPPAEARAIIVQHELQRASRHRTESYPHATGVSSKSAVRARCRIDGASALRERVAA